ncbi:MAG: hypothetical protein LVQ96_02825 [Thermoplasmatales archaeon]|nr:hypothetical protein [Thermoplasmatales archaeon]MCW6170084.1 hypothetical protein [Thermoplasmatales archaeon]
MNKSNLMSMTVTQQEVLSWLSGGDEKSGNLVDVPWKIQQFQKYAILENDKVPFSVYLIFENDIMRIFLKTGIETAVLENQERLSIYRTLLLLNRQLDLVKFMLDGMNEEVVSRVDLELDELSKNELNVGLSTLLSSLYLMVKALKLEDEFQAGIVERMVLMVKDMLKQGKSKDDIKQYLTEKMGLTADQAQSVIDQIVGSQEKKMPGEMYG